jgi:hypothetical protein
MPAREKKPTIPTMLKNVVLSCVGVLSPEISDVLPVAILFIRNYLRIIPFTGNE